MKRKLIAFVILATSSCGYAATKDVTMNLVDSDGKERNIGKITIQKTPYGLLFTLIFTPYPPAFMVFMYMKTQVVLLP